MSRGNMKAGAVVATQPSLNQYVNIADYMYYGQTVTWQESRLQSEIDLKPLMRNGKPVVFLNQKTGLFSEAFVTTGDGPRQIVIGFEGTALYKHSNEFTGAQVQDDAAIFAGQTALSFKGSARFARHVIAIGYNRGITKSNIFVTGHSLGAAEAEYAALKTGLGGTTFAAPGIGITGRVRPSKLTNYVDYGDPIGNYAGDGPNIYGSFLISPSIQHYGSATLIGSTSNQTTLMNDVADIQSGNTEQGAIGIGLAAVTLHPLTNYVSDLQKLYPDQNIQLFQEDNSTDAGVNFPLSAAGPTSARSAAADLGTQCFVTGTGIATTHGDRPVETLKVGDIVVTASGAQRAIRWIGCRAMSDGRPLRISAGAFGAGVPGRDLFLSPGHPVLVGANADNEGGHLVPIMCLINGTTIKRLPVETVTYWHVELETHDILLAEGLPAESYIDLGSRPWFAGADGALYDPDMAAPGMPGRCRPVAIDGPVVEAERRRVNMVFALRLASAAAWPDAQEAAPF